MVTNMCRNVCILVTLCNSCEHFTWLAVWILLIICRSEKYFEQTQRGRMKQFVSGTLYVQTQRGGMKHTICVRYIICPDAAWRNETHNLCPVHYMSRRSVEEWNTQFVSGTLYVQTQRGGMKHTICARYTTCPDAAWRNETHNLCPVHYIVMNERVTHETQIYIRIAPECSNFAVFLSRLCQQFNAKWSMYD
jgi:hypothetical protein